LSGGGAAPWWSAGGGRRLRHGRTAALRKAGGLQSALRQGQAGSSTQQPVPAAGGSTQPASSRQHAIFL